MDPVAASLPQELAGLAGMDQLQQIVLTVCPNSLWDQRPAGDWAVVPPSKASLPQGTAGRNLLTVRPGKKSFGIVILNKGGDRELSFKRFDPSKVESYEKRLRDVLRENAPSDEATPAARHTKQVISALRFRAAYQRFQEIHRTDSGAELATFNDPGTIAYRWEDYKGAIPERARERLEAKDWSAKQIGSGQILARVVAAIEMPGNNLVQWEGRQGPQSRVHRRLLEAKTKPGARRDLEAAFFDLFHRGKADEVVFARLIELCGRRYELLAYLFFIARPDRFLPIRTRSFDRAFAELGAPLRTEKQCDWENYRAYCGLIAEIRERLVQEGISDASLLDAHSFCWILARHGRKSPSNNPPAVAVPAPFSGRLKPAANQEPFAAKEDATIRDMQALAVKRAASGRVAEEIALASERERLRQGGRADLAERIENVSQRPGLGFDIRSFELDGIERQIEVKNVTQATRFFLSANEWLTSQARPNYWFYLVDEGRGNGRSAVVSELRATDLKAEHLQPAQYLVSFDT